MSVVKMYTQSATVQRRGGKPAGVARPRLKVTLVANLNLSGLHNESIEPAVDVLVPPLGLLSLAAVLQERQIPVCLVDHNYEIEQRGLKLDANFISRAVDIILSTDPGIVGFSTMCNSFHISLEMAAALRQRAPEVRILMGGPQVSFVDRETLSTFEFVDYVLRGEAERTLPRLIDALPGESGFGEIPGLTFRDHGRIVQNPLPSAIEDLDALPMPAWDLFPYDARGAYAIDVGRGCPFACTFCSTSKFFQRRFRVKSFDRIVAEVRWLQEHYDAGAITFVHDLFTANRKWVHPLCERLVSENLDFIWSASARVDTVDEPLLRHMGAAGCRALFFGIETGSQSLQSAIGKRLKIHTVEPVVAAALRADIAPTLSFIAGFPQETESDLRETFCLIEALLKHPQASVQLHLMSPQSGTPDVVNFADRFRYDGYVSDIASGSHVLRSHPWIQKYPNLFPSFYYFDNPALPRFRVRGADLFVRLACANMRHTVRRLLGLGMSLWDIYCSWKAWLANEDIFDCQAASQYSTLLPGDRTGVDGGARGPDDYLLAFLEFAEAHQRSLGVPVDDAVGRDEILAFYLRYYHKVDVRVPAPSAEQPATQAA